MSTIPTLQTPRLRLRPHRAGDLDVVAAMWGDPAVTRHIGGTPRRRDDCWRRLLATEGHWRWLGYGYWAVERDDAMIGSAGFGQFERLLNPPLDAPEIGWVFVHAAWGQGYATEVVGALTSWADARGWLKTVAIIDAGNRASLRVAQKSGYVRAGDVVFDGVPIQVHARLALRSAPA